MQTPTTPARLARAATPLLVFFAFLFGPGATCPASAASPASGNVGETAPLAEWQGATFTAATNAGNVQGCFDLSGRPGPAVTTGPAACDVFTVSVGLAPSYWQDKSGGLKVSIAGSEDVDLYIYRRNPDGTRGALVADAATSSVSESVLIEDATGDYYVVTIPYTVVSSGYRGSAELVYSASGVGLSSWLHDVSEPIPGVTLANAIVEQYRIPAEDGTLLDTWVARPAISEAAPVILEITPYYGGGSPLDPTNLLAGNFQQVAEIFVPRGYAVAISSVRGTGNSEGCFSIGGPQEARDSAAVIRNLAHQPWANGRVGMMGVSYPGTTPQDVWVEAPAELKTIVPISGISDLYKYNFVNGVHINAQGYAFNTYYWGMVGLSPVGLNGGDQLRDPVSVPGAIVGEVCAEQVWVQEGGLSSAVDGNKDGYWQIRDFLAELRAAPAQRRPSVFYIHGLQDWNVKPHMMEDWLPNLISDVPYKIWLGQWGHAYPDREDWWYVLTAWYDKFLKGVDTGILAAPRVQVKDDDGRWRHESIWPAKNPAKLTLHPRQDGTLARQAAPGLAAYHDYNAVLPPAGLQPFGPDRVVFVSEPLAEDLHVSGLPRFEADVTASGDRASLILTLAERTPDGDRAINYAAMSLNHVVSLEGGLTSVAGRKQRVGVNFFPQDDVIHAGSRIVLIAAGNTVSGGQPGPGLQPVASGSEITLDLANAKLVLPLDNTLTYEQ